jgi:serine/threonine protein kinase
MLHNPHRWKQIELLFHESLAVSEESRAGFLKERCGDDLELRAEVESLLESEGKSLDFIEQPVINAAHDFTTGSTSNRMAPGEILGHYEIVSFIGAGGMGQVYLAQDVLLGRKVAVKILAPALANNERGLRRFEKEARAASALNHPNILTIYEFGQFHGLHFIASEYVEGPTLRQTLDGHSLSPVAAIDHTLQIGKALEASHALGIVHRDIKPENVMIRGDGLVKVLDFGIVKLVESDSRRSNYPAALASSVSISQVGLVIGSARYMSPEQARGLEVDPRCDIFSLGVVLYEMIAGKAAFDGDTISDVIAEILKGTPQNLNEIAPDTPSEIQDILGKAMCKDRETRYQSVKEMLADLQHASGAIQLQAEHSGVAEARGSQAHPAIRQTGKAKTTSVEPAVIATPFRLVEFAHRAVRSRGCCGCACDHRSRSCCAIQGFRPFRRATAAPHAGHSAVSESTARTVARLPRILTFRRGHHQARFGQHANRPTVFLDRSVPQSKRRSAEGRR